jgi:uncharacterized protein YqgV (UPF0045/DUF77 family)
MFLSLPKTLSRQRLAIHLLDAGKGLKELVAAILEIIDKSGLARKLGVMQTTVEDDRSKVVALLLRCHWHSGSLPARKSSISNHERPGTFRLGPCIIEVDKA